MPPPAVASLRAHRRRHVTCTQLAAFLPLLQSGVPDAAGAAALFAHGQLGQRGQEHRCAECLRLAPRGAEACLDVCSHAGLSCDSHCRSSLGPAGLTTFIATQPAFHRSFCLRENMADISAKTQVRRGLQGLGGVRRGGRDAWQAHQGVASPSIPLCSRPVPCMHLARKPCAMLGDQLRHLASH